MKKLIIAAALVWSSCIIVCDKVSAQQIDTLDEAVISKTIDRNVNFTQTGLTKIDGKAFKKGFAVFSSPDVVKTLQMLTGVAAGTEMMSNLYVHGGDGSDNLYLLDGVPLYQICHLGGLFSSFNTDVVDDINFYKSGFPARYGGRTSSVVDVVTRDGSFDSYHGTVSVGLLDGRLQFEGPIVREKTSFNIAMRRSWIDAFLLPKYVSVRKSGKGSAYTYAFADINAKVTHRTGKNGKLTGAFYWGYDDLRMKNYAVHNFSDETNISNMFSNNEVDINWGNILGSVVWDGRLADGLTMRSMAFYSGSRSVLGMYTHEYTMADKLGKVSEYDNDVFNTSFVNDYGLNADIGWQPRRSHHVRAGLTYIFHDYRPQYNYFEKQIELGQTVMESKEQDRMFSTGHEAGIYAEDEMALAKWFRMNVGLRYSFYASDGHCWNSLEPRVALKFQCGPDVSIKASYSEMSQFSHLVASTYIDLPTNSWLPSTRNIAPMRSRQVAGGVYANLPAYLHLNVEGWWKSMENLIEYTGVNTVFPKLNDWENNFRTGRGLSYGLEVDFGYETERTSLNLFYTLSWTWRKFEDIYPDWYRDRNDNRHKITVMATHRFSKKVDVYAAWNYHSGNRLTLPSQYLPDGAGGIYICEEPNNVALPDYHRLDLGMNIRLKTKRGNESVWNVSVYNAYCRINPIFAMINSNGSYDQNGNVKEESFVGVGYGIIPILPTISYTFRF